MILLRLLTLYLCLFISPLIALELQGDFKKQSELPFKYVVNNSQNVEQLLASSPNWKNNTSGVLNLGPITDYVWLKISLNNPSQIELPLLLSIDNNLLDKISAFIQLHNRSLLTLDLGDSLPLMQRPIKHEAQLVPVDLPAQSSGVIYLQIQHHGALNIPLSLWHPIEYLKYKSKFNLIYGILAGFMLAMALSNFTVYSFTRKKYFLSAGFIITIIWLLNVHLYGFSYRYIYGNWQWLQQYAQPILVLYSCLLFTSFISQTLLNSTQLTSYQKPLKWLWSIATLLALSLLFMPIEVALLSAYIFSLILALGYWIVALIRYRQGATLRYAHVSLFSALVIAIAYQLCFELGLLSGALLDRPITYLCYLLTSIVLTYSLMRKYVSERDSKIQAQQAKLAQSKAADALLKERLHLQEQAQEDLESSIDERTFELQVTLRELEEKNRALEKLNMEDALTKVKNRRYFDKRVMMEVRRSRREQTILSVVMLDIDHFKRINDTYGHLVGDQAICAVAEQIQQHLKRPHDEVFRYGGEEFVLLLPNTNAEGAIELAQLIRSDLEKFQLTVGEHTLTMTISAGIHSAIARNSKNPTLFTDFADKALYQAKQQGRNRVVVYEHS
ncbi:diguanylate cyclase [Pseudoalteromonas sp. MSK9-3]|uniref:sensor domain-containing diguanylate cyclase n=1 Tax=Pseudoalteromonas sp. MSK9-3 TaxID=1897633 RepID=UPI000E6C07D7|nr:diguanylate cyclase [Pseudoalteromonas sp. MSK9-3]RJE71270.1 diguanylate cyclase [Pseudoalteromonas sp. MSK9-3]